jgi:hypothetical protein
MDICTRSAPIVGASVVDAFVIGIWDGWYMAVLVGWSLSGVAMVVCRAGVCYVSIRRISEAVKAVIVVVVDWRCPAIGDSVPRVHMGDGQHLAGWTAVGGIVSITDSRSTIFVRLLMAVVRGFIARGSATWYPYVYLSRFFLQVAASCFPLFCLINRICATIGGLWNRTGFRCCV